jgi:citrate synthase
MGGYALKPNTTTVLRSALTYIDGPKGLLMHGGYNIAELADKRWGVVVTRM